jgi:hypothetical protein
MRFLHCREIVEQTLTVVEEGRFYTSRTPSPPTRFRCAPKRRRMA